MKDGQTQRFCSLCGRFQMVADFDGTKRSCRDRCGRTRVAGRPWRGLANIVALLCPVSVLLSVHPRSERTSCSGGIHRVRAQRFAGFAYNVCCLRPIDRSRRLQKHNERRRKAPEDIAAGARARQAALAGNLAAGLPYGVGGDDAAAFDLRSEYGLRSHNAGRKRHKYTDTLTDADLGLLPDEANEAAAAAAAAWHHHQQQQHFRGSDDGMGRERALEAAAAAAAAAAARHGHAALWGSAAGMGMPYGMPPYGMPRMPGAYYCCIIVWQVYWMHLVKVNCLHRSTSAAPAHPLRRDGSRNSF